MDRERNSGTEIFSLGGFRGVDGFDVLKGFRMDKVPMLLNEKILDDDPVSVECVVGDEGCC